MQVSLLRMNFWTQVANIFVPVVWKEAVGKKNENWLAVAKDSTNAIVNNGITLLKSSSIW